MRFASFKSVIAACCLVLAALGGASFADAQIPSFGVTSFRAPPDPRWGPITVGDVNAAYRLLRDNHPGAAPALHDLAFQKQLTDAYKLALSRARNVTSYQGYNAVLEAFATSMGDKHIWSRPTFVVALPLWAGIIVSKRGNTYVVTDTEDPEKTLMGSSLIGCDGKSVDDLARDNLGGFRAVWSAGAQQIQQAPWLLIDEGNPFFPRPAHCVFQQGQQSQTVTLDWEQIKRENLLPRLQKAIGAGASGYGVRKVGDGYWIGLQKLMGDDAPKVVQAVEAQKDALRAAAFVVLDLRGNGGGSSYLGNEIAESLMGKDAVDARLDPSPPPGACADEIWRATTDNVRNLEFLQKVLDSEVGPDGRKAIEEELRASKAALAAGKPFSASIDCPPEPDLPAAKTQMPSLMHGRLILLTDSLCFSSCLVVTQDFRALGAFHIGQTTDSATHFVDVRGEYLPSGYSMFSTLQAMGDPHGADQVGPFVPDLMYDGDIADTPVLEKWVTDVVVPRAASSMAAH